MAKNVWGYWDCPFCCAKTIRGDKTECPHCGHARGQNVRFYMREGVLEYVPPEDTNKKQNWVCSFCDNQNAWELTQCAYCGARRDEAETTYFGGNVQHGEYGQDVAQNEPPPPPPDVPETPVTDSPEISETPVMDSEEIPETPVIRPVTTHYKPSLWEKLKLPVILSCLLMILLWIFIPVTRSIKVSSVSWNREIQIEKYTTVTESNWSIPSGGRLKYTRQEVHHTEKVIDHYEKKPYQVYDHDEITHKYKDLGNGQFEEVEVKKPVYRTKYRDEPVYRNKPVYATKYYYEIERWKYDHSLNSSGTDKLPYWAEIPKLQNNGKAGSERESKRLEHYYIYGKYNGKIKEYELSYDKWSNIEIGQDIKFKTLRFGSKVIGDIELLE